MSITMTENEKDKGETGSVRVADASSFAGRFILRLWDILRKILLSEHFVLYLCIVYFLVIYSIFPRIANLYNLDSILSNLWPLLVVCVGQTFVLIVAGIDLSQPSIMAVTSVIGGLIMSTELPPELFEGSPLWGLVVNENGGLLSGSPWAVPVGVAAMLLVGVLIGLLNGISAAKLKMPAFMVTLIAMMFFSALAIYLVKSENIRSMPDTFNTISDGSIFYVPYPLLIAGFLTLLAHYILNHTLLGHWFYAVGQNPEAAKISGVPTEWVTILAYVFSGFFAAVGAVLYSARMQGGRPTLGDGMLLGILGAVVIGGTSLFGGKGKIYWTLYGALFFTLLSNSLNIMNLSFSTIDMIKGSFIVLAATIDVLRTRILSRESY